MVQLSLWSISPLLAALVAVGLYLRLARKPRVPGMPAVQALLATVMFWSGCQFVESLLTAPEAKMLALKLSYVAIGLAPVLWFLFALSYARRLLRLPRWTQNLVAVVPMITIVLVFTNGWHHLMWRAWQVVDVDGYAALITERGPWFYVSVGYAYTLILAATTVLSFVLATATRKAAPVVGVVLAPLPVCAANLFSLLPGNPVPWFDITTLGLVAGVLILDGLVLRHGLLDDIPVLRDRVLEQLAEGVVVVRDDGQVVDCNHAALRILGMPRRGLGRTNIGECLPSLEIGVLLGSAGGGAPDCLEVQVGGRWYDVTGTRLDPEHPASDVVLAFRDVTVRRDTELALRVAQDELQRLAHTDPLTGLHNRRLFMDRLDEEIRRVERHRGCLSVIVLDLDHFKQINDRFGHDAGDRVLRAAAERTRAIKRATDVAARVGGEEFALLLPATDAEGARQLAQRLRRSIEGIDTSLLLGPVNPDQAAAGITAVTASFGVATVTAGRDDPAAVLRRADQALYQAKHGGRNQVCEAA